MKRVLLLAGLIVATTAAARWDTLLWDSTRDHKPRQDGDLLVLDVAHTNRAKIRNPEFRANMASIPTPALYDRASGAFIPWLGSIEASEGGETNRYTSAQRAGLRELVAIGTNYGLTARHVRRNPSLVVDATMEHSRTNTAAGTRALARALGALWIINAKDGE